MKYLLQEIGLWTAWILGRLTKWTCIAALILFPALWLTGNLYGWGVCL